MGSLSKLMNLIPGMGMAGIPKDMLNVQEDKLKKYRYIMDSMTEQELEDPDLITSSRIQRIADGSGCDPADVRELLKQFKQLKKIVKGLRGKDLEKMAKRMGGMKGMMGNLPKNMKFPGM
jgi:signal recognition particle subunit SRP54